MGKGKIKRRRKESIVTQRKIFKVKRRLGKIRGCCGVILSITMNSAYFEIKEE